MTANDVGSAPGYRYSDFPGLFWDAQPEARLDVTNPVALARILTRADAVTVGRLSTPQLIRDKLDALPIAEHVKTFWRAVLEHVPERGSGAARVGQ